MSPHVDLDAAGVLRLLVAQDPVDGVVGVAAVVASAGIPTVVYLVVVKVGRVLRVVDILNHNKQVVIAKGKSLAFMARGEDWMGQVGGRVEGEHEGLRHCERCVSTTLVKL